jgi:hypothetical protein
MNNKPFGGRNSEICSHPIDLKNKAALNDNEQKGKITVKRVLQMLTYFIDLFGPKAYHRPDYPIRIVEYQFVPVISSPRQTFWS